jgi:hypothetical protein
MLSEESIGRISRRIIREAELFLRESGLFGDDLDSLASGLDAAAHGQSLRNVPISFPRASGAEDR